MNRIAVVIAIFLALPALPQCSQSPVFSDPFRLSMLDVAVDGNDLWAATSYGIAVYDRSVDPPRLTTSLALAGTTRIVRATNGTAYVGSGNTLYVVRKNGQTLNVVRSVDAGAPLNDIAVAALSLFAATRNGIAQYDLLDLSKTPAVFHTSQTAVSSLAIVGSALFAADGDTSVESFDLTTLQPLATITAPANAIAVHAVNGKLYVSSTLQTTIFIGTTNAGSFPVGAAAVASISDSTVFVAGGDRTLRGFDLTRPGNPIDIFRDDLPPTGGTINRINALAIAGPRLYAAAGDIGLATYDLSTFTQPPLRGTAFAGATSILSTGDKFYAGSATGVTEFNASLVQARSWDGGRADVVLDGRNGFLLTSSGSSMTLWTLTSTIPQAVASATFPAAVSGGVLIGTTGYAVLANRTLSSADFAQATPVPQPVAVPLRPSSIARSGNAIVLADARDDGTTQLAYYASFPGSPQTASLPGLPTTAVTLSGTVAALQTFQGISIVDFAAGSTSLLPQSNDVLARQLLLSANTLLELTGATLRVWDTRARTFTDVTLPSQGIAVHIPEGSTVAVAATSTDVATIALDRLAQLPSRNLPPNGNAFYKKIAATSTRIYLGDDRGIDIFSTSMRYRGSIRLAGLVDFAADDSGVFTVGSNMTVGLWTPEGSLRGTAQINEGSDAQALTIDAVNGAAWVSLIRGCTSGACEKKTLVFNGTNQTTSMTGGIVDVAISGNRAYAITDIPSEVRVIDVSDPFHPAIVSSAAAQSPLAISYANGTLYVLGNTLTPYSEAGLVRGADILGPYSSDGTVTLADEHLRVDGNCAVFTGRTFAPQRFTLPGWTPASSFPTPSTARFVTAVAGSFYILTDHSLEIWSASPLPKPPRPHPAR